MRRKFWIIPVLFFLLFVFLSVKTLWDYGWNWDSFQHLARGQAYYHFLTTGKTSNADISSFQGRLSFYEKTPFDFSWASKMTIGHPPTTDIIMSVMNQIIYKRFGLIGDLESYQLYGVILTCLGSFIILLWSLRVGGWFGACISVLAYGAFPLLFSEQHFNIKDPAIAAYNIIFLYVLWLGVSKKRYGLLIAAGIIGGISLGTKFNILFLLPAVVIWLIWNAKGNISSWIHHQTFLLLALLVTVPIIMTVIFYCTYPALWSNPVQNVWNVVLYYQNIGGNPCSYVPGTGMWFIRCSDWNTAKLFITTLPLSTTVFAVIGSVIALKTVGQNGLAPFLWFITASSVILRVIFPINSLYGGSLRQIMEVIGLLALLAGYGANWIKNRYKKLITVIIMLLCYVPVIWTMVLLHPNENLYTNILADIFWGKSKQLFINGSVSYGNAYKQGIDWINSNAESNATVSLVTGIGSAIPSYKFRSDIRYSPSYWSAYKKQGEYLIELISPQDSLMQLFPYKYAMNELYPVFEKNVNGYPIVRVWKNDNAHTKSDFQRIHSVSVVTQTIKDNEITIRIPEKSRLQEMKINAPDAECRRSMSNSYVLISYEGVQYERMYEPVSEIEGNNEGNVLIYPFSGDSAQFIKLFTYNIGICNLQNVSFELFGFQ